VKVTVCRSTGRTRTDVMRGLDDDERRLVISTPWDQPPAKTIAAVWDRLSPEEQHAVADVFNLPAPLPPNEVA
jgi:hypothetical protein